MNRTPVFCWVKVPTSAELTHLTHTIARHVGSFLERDVENSYLAGDVVEVGSLEQVARAAVRCFRLGLYVPIATDQSWHIAVGACCIAAREGR